MGNLRRWSSSASGNSSVAGGANTINFAEGQAPGSVNNSAREMMAQVRGIYTPAEWGWVEFSATASVASQTTIKLTGNQTTNWTAGRRWRLKSASTTRYGSVVSSSFTAETTITVTVDSGSLSASHSLAALAAIDSNHVPGFSDYARLASANTFTAAQTISTGASQALLLLTANAAVAKTIQFLTGATSRWVVSSEATAESGANAGSNFIINNYNDAGAYLSTPFQITRSTGNVGIGVTPTAKLHVLDLFDGNKTICSFNNISNVSTATAASIDLVADQSWVRFTTTRDGAGTSAALTISPTVAGTPTDRLRIDTSGNILNVSSGGLGYGTGSGGAVTQLTSRTTGVTLNKTNGSITLFSAANSTTFRTFTVTNSTVAATDVILLSQRSGVDRQQLLVTNVAAGSFDIAHATTTGTTTEAPIINFAVIKAVTS
jgi:hypothetical protein